MTADDVCVLPLVLPTGSSCAGLLHQANSICKCSLALLTPTYIITPLTSAAGSVPCDVHVSSASTVGNVWQRPSTRMEHDAARAAARAVDRVNTALRIKGTPGMEQRWW